MFSHQFDKRIGSGETLLDESENKDIQIKLIKNRKKTILLLLGIHDGNEFAKKILDNYQAAEKILDHLMSIETNKKYIAQYAYYFLLIQYSLSLTNERSDSVLLTPKETILELTALTQKINQRLPLNYAEKLQSLVLALKQNISQLGLSTVCLVIAAFYAGFCPAVWCIAGAMTFFVAKPINHSYCFFSCAIQKKQAKEIFKLNNVISSEQVSLNKIRNIIK